MLFELRFFYLWLIQELPAKKINEYFKKTFWFL
jgi:hypothetical protein